MTVSAFRSSSPNFPVPPRRKTIIGMTSFPTTFSLSPPGDLFGLFSLLRAPRLFRFWRRSLLDWFRKDCLSEKPTMGRMRPIGSLMVVFGASQS